jgi:hypothetical protein
MTAIVAEHLVNRLAVEGIRAVRVPDDPPLTDYPRPCRRT